MYHLGQLLGTSDLGLSAFLCSRAMQHKGPLGRVHLTRVYLHSGVVELHTTRVD